MHLVGQSLREHLDKGIMICCMEGLGPCEGEVQSRIIQDNEDDPDKFTIRAHCCERHGRVISSHNGNNPPF